MTIHATINGEKRELPDATTIADVVASFGIADGERVAVELNREILDRSTCGDTPVPDGAEVEVIRFMGGGAHV